MSKKKRWHLLAMANNDQNVAIAQTEKYVRITKSYILVYTKSTKKFDKPQDDVVLTYQELTETSLRYLSNSDIEWLFDCASDVIANLSDADEKKMYADMSAKLDRLEKALNELAQTSGNEETNVELQLDAGTE